MATALTNSQTMDFKKLAIQAQQLKDNLGNAVDITELTNPSGGHLAAGATKTLTSADAGKWVDLDTAAGSIVTLPAATGSGRKYKFRVKVLATSNSHVIQVANSSDAMQGILIYGDDTSSNAQWFAAVSGTSDTITLNRTTTGSVILGEYIEIEDIAANLFHVRGVVTNTGTAATPFSAAV